jgi:two-component system chemotaxis response regulator CheB
MFDAARFAPSRAAASRPLSTSDRTWSHRNGEPFEAVGIVGSAGGFHALREILQGLPPSFPGAVLVAIHRADALPDKFTEALQVRTALPVHRATEGEPMLGGTVYAAPAGRHLVVEPEPRLSVARTERHGFVRPSGDLLLASLASVFGDRAVGVVLSGMGRDGSAGVESLRRAGGFVIAQDLRSCTFGDMPSAAVETRKVDLTLATHDIAAALCSLAAPAA